MAPANELFSFASGWGLPTRKVTLAGAAPTTVGGIESDRIVAIPRVQFITNNNTSGNAVRADGNAGNGLSAENVRGGVALRKRVNDISFSLYATDATARALPDQVEGIVSAEKELSAGLFGSFSYDIGARNAALSAKYRTTVDLDKEVEVKATWVQQGNILHAEAAIELDANNKIGATYNLSAEGLGTNYLYTAPDGFQRGFPIAPPNDPISFLYGYQYPGNNATLSYTLARGDWAVSSLYNVGINALRLTGTYLTTPESSVRVSYDLRDELAAVEYLRAPFRVSALARVNQDGVSQGTLGVTFEQELEI